MSVSQTNAWMNGKRLKVGRCNTQENASFLGNMFNKKQKVDNKLYLEFIMEG